MDEVYLTSLPAGNQLPAKVVVLAHRLDGHRVALHPGGGVASLRMSVARMRKVSVCYGKPENSNSVGESKGVSGSLNPQATVSSRAGKGQQGGSDNSGDDNLFNEVRVYLEKVLFV